MGTIKKETEMGAIKKRRKNDFGNSIGTKIFIVLMLAYPILQFLVFWVYINVDTISLTFSRFDVTTGKYVFWGMERYAKIFHNMILGENVADRTMFINSFRAIVINFIILPLAVVTAYAFYKKVPGEKIFRVLFYLPSMISLVVLTMIFRNMFSADFGPIAYILNKITGQDVSYLSLGNDYLWNIIYLFCIWAGLGSNVILMCGAMQRIPEEVVESAMLDGVGFWRELFNFTIPLIMPTIGVFVLTAVMSVSSFVMQPMLLALSGGEQNKYMTVGWYIFEAVQGSDDSIIQSAATGVVFSTINMPLVLIAKIVIDKLTPDVSY